MPELNLSPTAQVWVNIILLWIGFSAVVGLVVRCLFPGKEPQGLLGMLLIGILGSSVGPFLVTILWPNERFNPISPIGFSASVICAFVLLIVFRLFSLLTSKVSRKTG